MKKLNLGSGNNHIEGYISVDKYDKEAEVRADIVDLPYEDESVDEIVCYQVIEHMPYNQSTQVFEEMYRVLKPGATAIVETVDFDIVAQGVLEEGLTDKWIRNIYGEYYRPQDRNRYEDWEMHEGSVHRNPWNKSRLREIAEEMGFKVRFRPMEEKHEDYRYEECLSAELTKD